MNVLVIGGTLFIGRPLVSALLKQGHRVTILHRSQTHPFGKSVASLSADRNDAGAVRSALMGKRFDAVFDNVYDWERGTSAAQVLATARACGDVQRYVFMSSVAAYGDGLSHHEDDLLAPDDHPSLYVRQKAMSERALFEFHELRGFPAVTLRPPFIYGPGNPFYREAFFWDRLRKHRPIVIPGDGSRQMQFIYVHDLVAACLRTLETETAIGQAFNVAHAKPVTQLKLVRGLAAAAGTKPVLVRVPREIIERLGAGPMVAPFYFGEYFDLPPITMTVQKMRRLLRITPTPFPAGLKETFRWYRRQKHAEFDVSLEDRLIAAR
jgi:nucleoside-diphosphate-sugar epimerase